MKCIKWLNVIQGLFVALALVSTVEARVTTIAWDANPSWPSGTTIELEANGATANGIPGTQYTLDVPVQPGGIIDARARAIPPADYQCGDPVGTCPPSGWATLVQTMPAAPIGLWATKALQEGGTTMALSLSALTSGSSTSNPATTASISPTAGRKWLAVITVSMPGGYSTSASDSLAVSGAGLTWTQLSRVATWGTRRALYVFRGDGTPSSGALTLTFTPNFGAAEQLKWAIVELDGIDTTTPYGTAYTNSGSGTAASVTVSETPDAGDFILFLHGQEDGNTDTLNSELDTSLIRIGDSTGSRRFGISYDSAPDSTPAPGVTWTGSCSWGAIGFVLNAGAGGGSQALAGDAAAVASATGAATMAIPVAATAASIATADGSMAMALPMQASATVEASASGAVSLSMALSGSALSEALASGALGLTMPLAGDAASESIVTGDLTTGGEADLSGDALAQATATGGVEHTTGMASDAVAQSTGTGQVTLSMALSGAAISEALAAAGITLESALAAQAAAQASATGNTGLATDMIGGAAAEASAAGDVSMTTPMTGDAQTQASAAGDVTALAEGALAGSAAALISASGLPGMTTPIAGEAQILALAGGDLGMSLAVAGAASATLLSTGNLQISLGLPLDAAVLATASASGTLLMTIPLDAVALAQATAAGALSGGTETFIPYAGRTWTPGYTPRIWEPLASQRTWVAAANNRTWRR